MRCKAEIEAGDGGSSWGSCRPAPARLCYRGTHWAPTSILHLQGILYSAVPADQYWLTLLGWGFFKILSKGEVSREFHLFLNSCLQISFYFQFLCNCRVAEAAELLVASPKTSHVDWWSVFKPSLFIIDLCPSLTWLGSSQQWLCQVFAL